MLVLPISDIICVGITIPGSSVGYIERRAVTHIYKDGVWTANRTNRTGLAAQWDECVHLMIVHDYPSKVFTAIKKKSIIMILPHTQSKFFQVFKSLQWMSPYSTRIYSLLFGSTVITRHCKNLISY